MMVQDERHSHLVVDEGGRHHEHSDINVRGILWVALGLFVSAAMIQLLIFGLFGYFAKREAPAGQQPSIESLLPAEAIRLQKDPEGDLKRIQEEVDRIMNGYRWMDREAGVARIPVERAMKLLLERGLPVGPPASQPEAAPNGPGATPERRKR